MGIHDLADRMTRPTNDTFYHKYNATSCVGLKNGNHIQDSVTDIYIYIHIHIVKNNSQIRAQLLAPHCSCNMQDTHHILTNTLLRVILTMASIRFVTCKSSSILSDISSNILSGISSGILSGISSGILSGISSGSLPGIYSAICSGISSGTLSGISS